MVPLEHRIRRSSRSMRMPPRAFRTGNGGSMEKCRRRWDLAEADFLKYKFMYAFDRAMNHLDKVRGPAVLVCSVAQPRFGPPHKQSAAAASTCVGG